MTDADDPEVMASFPRQQAKRRRLEAVMSAQHDPNVHLACERDASGRVQRLVVTHANDAALADLGRTREGLVGQPIEGELAALLPFEPLAEYLRTVETGSPTVLLRYGQPRTGEPEPPRILDLRAARIHDGVVVTWHDVTRVDVAERARAEAEDRYRLLADTISEVVMLTRFNTVTWVSPSLTRVLGWAPEEWIGRFLGEFAEGDDLADFNIAREAVGTGALSTVRMRLADRAGAYHWCELRSQEHRTADGLHESMVSAFRVIDAQVAAEEELGFRTRYDSLTGVLNRAEVLAQLGGVRAARRSPGDHIGVLYVGVDYFKRINDAWGHAAGDALLAALAARIHDTLRAADSVARMGGDEFLVVLEGVHDLEDVVAVAEKVRSVAAEPFTTPFGVLTATVSVGAVLGRREESGDSLVSRADAAMYRAKQDGRDRVVVLED